MCTQDCSNLYRKGLTAVVSLQQQSAQASTLQTSDGAVTELYQSGCRQSMHQAAKHCRLPHHAGLPFRTEGRVATPSSLAGIKSHLATEFELLGRTGGWDPATQQGNPMHSMQIRGMLSCYCCGYTLELNTFLYLGFTSFCC